MNGLGAGTGIFWLADTKGSLYLELESDIGLDDGCAIAGAGRVLR